MTNAANYSVYLCCNSHHFCLSPTAFSSWNIDLNIFFLLGSGFWAAEISLCLALFFGDTCNWLVRSVCAATAIISRLPPIAFSPHIINAIIPHAWFGSCSSRMLLFSSVLSKWDWGCIFSSYSFWFGLCLHPFAVTSCFPSSLGSVSARWYFIRVEATVFLLHRTAPSSSCFDRPSVGAAATSGFISVSALFLLLDVTISAVHSSLIRSLAELLLFLFFKHKFRLPNFTSSLDQNQALPCSKQQLFPSVSIHFSSVLDRFFAAWDRAASLTSLPSNRPLFQEGWVISCLVFKLLTNICVSCFG